MTGPEVAKEGQSGTGRNWKGVEGGGTENQGEGRKEEEKET